MSSSRLSMPHVVDSNTLSIPPPLPFLYAGSGRPGTLTPVSVLLLGHYLAETAGILAMAPSSSNPLVTVLLPLGHADDLLMHGLLAVSGAHMACREKDRTDVAEAACLHYTLILSRLRVEFSSLREDDSDKMERLLRVLLVLCQYEAISGDMNGHIFSHLRASHHLISSVLRSKSASNHTQITSPTMGLCLEWYAYLVSCNTFTPHGMAISRSLPFDVISRCRAGLETYHTFGTFLSGCHELHYLIPLVSRLSSRRLSEETQGLAQPSRSLREDHDRLHEQLTTWTMPDMKLPASESSEDLRLRQHAAEALRHAIHIFLTTSLAGAIVDDPALRAVISQHVHAVFAETPHLINARKYVATIVWPVLIAGSCLAKPEWQGLMLREMREGWFQMGQLNVWAELLKLLYEDPDPRAFGPYGLHLMMEKHGMNVGNA
ncbi:hypothetical protein MBLNU230_g7355t1 [Neophaeotheca triangularis]